ncbi:FOG: Transposase [Streptomyces sp. MA5143a]|nr:FOG: Transposase [Streptomyces sp. MA5143a]
MLETGCLSEANRQKLFLQGLEPGQDDDHGVSGVQLCKNSWQPAEQAGHSTLDGLQHLLAGSMREPDDIRDDLQEYVAAKLGDADGALIIDDTGFIRKGNTSAGVQRQYSGTVGRTENCQIGVFAAYAYAYAYAFARGRRPGRPRALPHRVPRWEGFRARAVARTRGLECLPRLR